MTAAGSILVGMRGVLVLFACAALFVGDAYAHSAPSIDCATAKTLAAAPARPAWFPMPQPPGRFTANTNALPIFVHGLEWLSERRYFWLVREPRGANLGEIGVRSKVAAHPYLPKLHYEVKVLRLADDGRLFAQWPTFGRYPDLTAAVAKGETLPAFLTYLRSLRRITWPKGCGAGAAD